MVQIKLSVVFILAAAIASVQVVALPFPAKDQDSSKSSKTIQATSTLPPHNELPQQTGQPGPETPPSNPNTNPKKRKQMDQPETPPLEKDQVKVPPQKKQKRSYKFKGPLKPLFTTKPLELGSGKGFAKQGDATITSNTGSHSAPGGSSTASGSIQAHSSGLSTASSSTQAHSHLGSYTGPSDTSHRPGFSTASHSGSYTGASDIASHGLEDPYYWPGQEYQPIHAMTSNTASGSSMASGSMQHSHSGSYTDAGDSGVSQSRWRNWDWQEDHSIHATTSNTAPRSPTASGSTQAHPHPAPYTGASDTTHWPDYF